MAQDINSSSPWDALQSILSQQKVDQRQKLVDSVSLLNTKSEMDYRNQQAKSQEAQRAAQTAEIQAKSADRDRFHKGITDYLSTAKLSPEERQEFALAGSSPTDDLLQTILARHATPEQDVMTYDEAANTYSPAMNPTTHQPIRTRGTNPIVTRNRPPQAPREPQDAYVGTNADGQIVSGHNGAYYTTDDKGTHIPFHGVIGAKPASHVDSGPNATDRANLAKLRTKATPKSGFFGSTFGSTKPNDQDVAAFNQALTTYISKYNTTPDVRDTVRDIIDNHPEELQSPDLIERHKGAFSTPEELEQFADLIATAK